MSHFLDALSAVRRSNQAYDEQITDQTALGCGVAFTCPRYPLLPEGNQLKEVVMPPGGSMASAFAEAETFYAARNLRCHRWVPASTQPLEPIEAFLLDRGYRPVRFIAMAQTRPATIDTNPHIRVLQARAMRKAFAELKHDDPARPPEIREMAAQAALDRLDDPQLDMLIAMMDGRPAGHGALLQTGDIGRIIDLYVAEPFRRQGLGQTLMSHLLGMSHRLAMRITCLEVEETNTAAIALYDECGFDAGGSYVEFHAPVQSP